MCLVGAFHFCVHLMLLDSESNAPFGGGRSLGGLFCSPFCVFCAVPFAYFIGGISDHHDACTIWCVTIIPCLAAEAARILGVTPATVRLMESRGELPATRTASGVRIFDRAAVERLAAERTADRDSTSRNRHIA